jgi:hypothetical protein
VTLPLSAVDAIQPAIEHAKRQLLQPFRFGQWIRLALVGLLAGELGSGGGCNVNVPATHHDKGTQQFLSSLPPEWMSHPAILVGLLLLLLIAGFGLLLVFMYISSVMRFVLFDSVIAKECRIREGWRRRKNEGLQLFAWQIVLSALSFAAFIVLIGIPLGMAWVFGWFKNPKEHLVQLILGGIALFLIFLALALVMAVVHVMTKDFVVPQMALESLSAMEGWRRLWPRITGEKTGYAGYIGMKIVLAIGAGVLIGIASLIVIIMLLLPVGGATAVVVLAGKAAGWTWNLYTISFAVVAGLFVLIVLIFVVSFLNVPGIVFFPAYSMHFFAGRYPPLAEMLWPVPPALQPPSVPPAPPQLLG